MASLASAAFTGSARGAQSASMQYAKAFKPEATDSATGSESVSPTS